MKNRRGTKRNYGGKKERTETKTVSVIAWITMNLHKHTHTCSVCNAKVSHKIISVLLLCSGFLSWQHTDHLINCEMLPLKGKTHTHTHTHTLTHRTGFCYPKTKQMQGGQMIVACVSERRWRI